MRIILSGMFFPLDFIHYYIRAFKRRKDVELVTIGPYTENWMPWHGGTYVDMKYARQPDILMDQWPDGTKWSMADAERVLGVRGYETWDAWIQFNNGFCFIPGRPSKGKHFGIGTDATIFDYTEDREYVDVFFNMHRHYKEPSDIYLPYAYDSEWHVPSPVPVAEREYDIVMIGSDYKVRRVAVAELSEYRKLFVARGLFGEDYRDKYHQSKIGWTWSMLTDLTPRIFELAAMKLPVVCNWVPDLPLFLDEGADEVLTFNGSVPDCLRKTNWMLDHPEKAEEYAERAYQAVQGQSYDDRVEKLLSYL